MRRLIVGERPMEQVRSLGSAADRELGDVPGTRAQNAGFFEPPVWIQAEKGEPVIDTGPYAVVRHPTRRSDESLETRPSRSLLPGHRRRLSPHTEAYRASLDVTEAVN